MERQAILGLAVVAVLVGLGIGAVVHAETSESPKLHAPSRIGYRVLNGQAFVSTERPTVRAGEPLILQMQFQCEGGYAAVYDPFFRMADPSRVTLRVFDAERKYVGNALAAVARDDRSEVRWLMVQEGEITGRALRLETEAATSYATGARVGDGDRDTPTHLGEGKYFVQLVFLGRFLDVCTDDDETPRPRPGLKSSQEICHSNVLVIEVLPRR